MPRLLLTTLVTALGAASPAFALPDETLLLSGQPGTFTPFAGLESGAALGREAVSADGRYVAFSSRSDGLHAEPTGRAANVFVRDRVTGTVVLVSRRTGAEGAPATGECGGAAISDDGRRVAFTCSDRLDDADTNSVRDVYLRDLDTATTRLVSRASGGGAVGDAPSDDASISANGRRVAFSSLATNLAADDGDSVRDVFRYDDVTLQVVLVSRAGSAGAAGTGDSFAPSLSGGGAQVAFTSAAPNLDPSAGDANGAFDVYVRDVTADTTRLASAADQTFTAEGALASVLGTISDDGLHVAFASAASNLVSGDANGTADVFRRTLANGTTIRVSGPSGGGGDAAGAASSPVIDADGTRVAFLTTAPDVSPGDADARTDVHVRIVSSQATQLVSRASGAGGTKGDGTTTVPAISADGATVTFGASATTLPPGPSDFPRGYARDLDTTTTEWVTGAPGAGPGAPAGNFASTSRATAISADGVRVAFVAASDGLSPDDVDQGDPALEVGMSAAYVRDTRTGAVTLASRGDGADGVAPNGPVYEAAISADGRRVAFTTDATNLDPADVDPRTDVYVRDLAAGRTWLASRATGSAGAIANAASFDVSLSGDGHRVAFVSPATNLGDGDGPADSTDDVFVRDVEAQTTVVASARADGVSAATSASDARISAGGAHVAFVTAAANLGVADDMNDSPDVYLATLVPRSLALVSRDDTGLVQIARAAEPAVAADGRTVAFSASGSPLAPQDADPETDVYVRDLAAERTRLLSPTAPDSGASFAPAISGDGSVVAFATTAAGLAPAPQTQTVVVTGVAGGDILVAARAEGAAGRIGVARAPSLSGDGGCVVFTGNGAPLVDGATADHSHVYLRTRTPTCPPRPTPGGPQREPGPVVPPSGGPGGGTTGADRTPPRITGARWSPARFRVRAGRSTPPAPLGGTLRFAIDEPATVRVGIQSARPGRVRGARCVLPSAAPRRAQRCARWVTAGTIVRAVTGGRRRLAFRGRLGRRVLPAGRHRARITATDRAGNATARPVHASFRVVAVTPAAATRAAQEPDPGPDGDGDGTPDASDICPRDPRPNASSCAADLAITALRVPATIDAPATVEVSVAVRNNGPSDVAYPALDLDLPLGAIIQSGPGCLRPRCDLPALPAGATATASWRILVQPGEGTVSAPFTAVLSGAGDESAPADNEVTVRASVRPTTCQVRPARLLGKTLAAARSAIRAAGCRVAKVRQPSSRPRRGTRRVVAKATIKGRAVTLILRDVRRR